MEFEELTKANIERCRKWHPGFPEVKDAKMWTGADWSNAAAGEMGEACNVVKKIRRKEFGLSGKVDPEVKELVFLLGEEIADTIIYLDLLATYYEIDLPTAIKQKFNVISIREGFPDRL